MRTHLLGRADAESLASELELSMDESAGGRVYLTQQSLVVPRLDEDSRFPKVSAALRRIGVESYCLLPLTTSMRKLGAIGFGRSVAYGFDESEIEFLQQVARQVAVAVDNVLNAETARRVQGQLAHERDRLRLLLEITNAVVSRLELPQIFAAVSQCLRGAIQHDGSALVLYDADRRRCRVHVLDFSKDEEFVEEREITAECTSPTTVALTTGKPAVFRRKDLESLAAGSDMAQRLLDRGVHSFCSVPLVSRERVLGALNVGRRSEEAFSPEDVELLSQAAQQIAIAVDNGLAYREIAELKEKLSKEKVYLEGEIKTQYNFEEIIGESARLKQALQQVEIVAPTDSTVLILGETGTGKELLARAIHNLSRRRGRTFMKINCAAIPTGLLESELFGHERGAFTGAIAQKIGRFEAADQGTLFLDEVGDIPLELQSKLLRVLQEQEFERLGSTKTLRVNVRLVAATHRDLEKMVAEKLFRNDLYYRLHVFPLSVPPLRERAEDIPMLVRYFTQKFARQMNRQIDTIPRDVLDTLSRYAWPGNIRELENLIERAVILSQGSELRVPLDEARASATASGPAPATLEAAEREHIMRALNETGWVIAGPRGAAGRLGMKRTTLQSKMQKLGISRPE
jgi:formate hydrogenlyase transcriptional activator